jgi:ClpP class serine protease
MSRELFRLTERLYGTPLLADQQTIKNVIGYLEDRNSGQADLRALDIGSEPVSKLNLGEVGVATLEVSGPLSYNTNMLQALCGNGELSSYEGIDEAMDEIVASGNVKTLAVTYDTGGGEARGSFETARRLRQLADDNGIHLISFIEGGCNSAGYVLGCTAHEIIMMDDNATSVGSIGALVALKNDIPKEMKDGSEVLFISAGDDKVPFDTEGKFKQDFLDELQASVDLLRGDFISHVASFRDMTEKQVGDTQAKSYQPEKALELGLVDKVMGREDFINYLADLRNENEGVPKTASPSKLESIGDSKMSDKESKQLEELQAQMAELTATLESQSEALALAEKQRDAFALKEKEDKAIALKAQVEGFSFASEGLDVLLGSVSDEVQEAVLASLESAEEAVLEAKTAQASAESESNSEMFEAKSDGGEAEVLDPQAKLQASVAEAIKLKHSK